MFSMWKERLKSRIFQRRYAVFFQQYRCPLSFDRLLNCRLMLPVPSVLDRAQARQRLKADLKWMKDLFAP